MVLSARQKVIWETKDFSSSFLAPSAIYSPLSSMGISDSVNRIYLGIRASAAVRFCIFDCRYLSCFYADGFSGSVFFQRINAGFIGRLYAIQTLALLFQTLGKHHILGIVICRAEGRTDCDLLTGGMMV